MLPSYVYAQLREYAVIITERFDPDCRRRRAARRADKKQCRHDDEPVVRNRPAYRLLQNVWIMALSMIQVVCHKSKTAQ
jgi:hypothetical protein